MFSFFRKKKNESLHLEEANTIQEPFNTYGLNDVLHFVKRETGVDLFPKQNVIETRLRVFAQNNGCSSFRKLYERIEYEKELKQELINLLTVNETYFYRELSQLQEAVDFAKSKSNISILCAPCATGEEVYTLSMLLEEDYKFNGTYSITGVDINSEAISKAQLGQYSARSLHKLDQDIINRYFDKDNEKFRVKQNKFLHVRFSKINIFDTEFLNFGQYDIIFSRNMLIYFDEDFRLQAMKRFVSLLKPEGRIYLGHADIIPHNDFLEKHGFGSSCYYTKKTDGI